MTYPNFGGSYPSDLPKYSGTCIWNWNYVFRNWNEYVGYYWGNNKVIGCGMFGIGTNMDTGVVSVIGYCCFWNVMYSSGDVGYSLLKNRTIRR